MSIDNTSLRLAVGIVAALCCASGGADMIDTSEMSAWEVCALCHGADGVSVSAKFPKLAGQKRPYIEYQLRQFRQRQRMNDGGQMQSVSTEVGEDDIAGIAAYFSRLPLPALKVTEVAAERLQQQHVGKQLFEQGKPGVPACRGCHGRAKSPAPWLDSQHELYLRKQLQDFAAGKRQSQLAPMVKIASALTNDEIDALAMYLSSVRLRRTK